MRPNLPLRKPRSRAKEGPAFVFVDTTETRTGRPEDQDARALIRRQAARSGRKNQRSQVLSREASNNPGASSRSREVVRCAGSEPYANDGEATLVELIDPFLAPQLSWTGYEALRMKYNFDITYLTTLTDVSLGKFSSLLLQEDPALVGHLLRQQPSSFLSYLPSRYGSSPCLDAAMHCLAAGAGQAFGLRTTPAAMTASYGKALQSLQAALTDGSAYLGSDVYCATRLLTLYELISRPEAGHWVLHNRGGTNLVQLRGPQNHTSPFDWMLLKSQGPSIIVDSIFTARHTIFEVPEWQSVFEQASDAESDPDAKLWWELFRTLSFVPGVLADLRELCTRTLSQPLSQTQYFADSSSLLERTKWVHDAIHDSHIRYQNTAPHLPSLFRLPSAPESPDRIRLRLFYSTALMQMSRALATISEDKPDRAAGEVEAQTIAAQALLIPLKTADLDPAMAFHFQQRSGLPTSIVKTRALWEPDREPKSAGLAEFLANRWLKWHFFVDNFLLESLKS
ncbi:hypothetical protein BDV12DRAFT_208255 [Aspergillus spectabilis]